MKLGRLLSITDVENYVTDIFNEYGITKEAIDAISYLLDELAAHEANPSAHFSNVISLSFIIDGGGSAITTGQKGHLEIPFACTITGWTIMADQVGSIVVDVWKDTHANFPPTAADTIAGSEKPTLVSAQGNGDYDLTTWTKTVAAGDILAFNVDSCTTITRVTLDLIAEKA